MSALLSAYYLPYRRETTLRAAMFYEKTTHLLTNQVSRNDKNGPGMFYITSLYFTDSIAIRSWRIRHRSCSI